MRLSIFECPQCCPGVSIRLIPAYSDCLLRSMMDFQCFIQDEIQDFLREGGLQTYNIIARI